MVPDADRMRMTWSGRGLSDWRIMSMHSSRSHHDCAMPFEMRLKSSSSSSGVRGNSYLRIAAKAFEQTSSPSGVSQNACLSCLHSCSCSCRRRSCGGGSGLNVVTTAFGMRLGGAGVCSRRNAMCFPELILVLKARLLVFLDPCLWHCCI